MGARQSKRSVDITTTPKKGDGEVAVEGEGKLEKIGDVADLKATTNGALPHADTPEDKDENAKDAAAEKDANAAAPTSAASEVKENGVSEPEDAPAVTGKTSDGGDDVATAAGDQLNESASGTTTGDKTPEGAADNKGEETPEGKKGKDGKGKKKKWSFRSISFSKKDKSKPAAAAKEGDKNGEVKEVAEENAEETATSPTTESPKAEEPKPVESLTNGEPAPAEEPAKTPTVVEEPKAAEEPKEEPPKQEEPRAEEATTEETKEVPTEASNEVRHEDAKPADDTAVKTEAAAVEE